MILGVDDISLFKIFFDVIYSDTETVELVGNSTGVKVSLLDKSHVSFYEVFYENSFFDMFDVDGTEIMSLFIDDLNKILKNSTKDDYLTLSSDDTHVVAKFENNGNSRVFELVQAMDFKDSAVPPSFNPDCTVEVSLKDLSQSLKDLGIFKVPNLKLTCSEQGFEIAADENSGVSYRTNMDIDVTGIGTSYYSMDYIEKITKFNKLDDKVILGFGDTVPLSWKIENPWVHVSGLIAPRIQED